MMDKAVATVHCRHHLRRAVMHSFPHRYVGSSEAEQPRRSLVRRYQPRIPRDRRDQCCGDRLPGRHELDTAGQPHGPRSFSAMTSGRTTPASFTAYGGAKATYTL